MDLDSELEARRTARLLALGAPGSAAEVRAIDDLRACGAEARAVRAGERAPPFRLPAVRGGSVGLDDLVAPGPAVLLFLCGLDCGFCAATARAHAERRDRFRALRTSVAAIAPWSVEAGDPRDLDGITALVDSGLHVARAYGLVCEGRGIDWQPGTRSPDAASTDALAYGHRRPLAATIVVGADGTVRYARVDVDYRRRQNPDALLAMLAAHERGGAR